MDIIIDAAKCRKCGICAKVCTMGAIAMRDGMPAVVAPSHCIRCHHCYAACPAGAVAMDGLDTAASYGTDVPCPTPESVMELLRRRYSCREYLREAIPLAAVAALRAALDSAPTGCNARATRHFILPTPEATDILRKEIYARVDAMPPEILKANNLARSIRISRRRGLDPVLRGAPAIAISAYRRDAPTGLVDCVVALAQFEVLAQSFGFGTCWCGFIPLVVKDVWPEMASWLGLPPEYDIGYAMLFGRKAVQYSRPVSPVPALSEEKIPL